MRASFSFPEQRAKPAEGVPWRGHTYLLFFYVACRVVGRSSGFAFRVPTSFPGRRRRYISRNFPHKITLNSAMYIVYISVFRMQSVLDHLCM